MKNKKGASSWIWIVLAVVIIGAIIFFILPKENVPVEPQTTASGNNVQISGFEFKPLVLAIKPGDTVTWTNKDSAAHIIVSDTGTEINSPSLAKGQSFSHTFSEKGEYDYHCSIHPTMKGKIIVE